MSYTDRIYDAIKTGGPGAMLAELQATFDAVRNHLAECFEAFGSDDWPFLLVALEISAAQLRGHMSPKQLELADVLREHTVGVSTVRKRKEG